MCAAHCFTTLLCTAAVSMTFRFRRYLKFILRTAGQSVDSYLGQLAAAGQRDGGGGGGEQ